MFTWHGLLLRIDRRAVYHESRKRVSAGEPSLERRA
jgi:hypothetical protein